jgi:hypothetical protein
MSFKKETEHGMGQARFGKELKEGGLLWVFC